MFRGREKKNIDDKGRLIVPADFRVDLQQTSDQPPILTNQEECLALYPWDAWHEEEERLLTLDSFDPDVKAFRRYMVSGASKCPIDKTGRILVPPALREFAVLKKEVIFAGVGPLIEIWDKKRFDADLLRTQSRYHEISAAVARMES